MERGCRSGGIGRAPLRILGFVLHIYPLCKLHPVSLPWPSRADSTPPTAFPGLPSRAGRSTPSTSTPAARPPRSGRRSDARRRRSGASPIMRSTRAALVFDRFVRYLIQGNVLRGDVYPLSVAAERTQQAISVIEVARAIGATAVAHGSTGAGNDQVRFDVALRVLASDLAIVTPIRDEGLSRDAGHRLPRGAEPAGAAKAGRILDQRRPLGHHLGRRLDARHLGRAPRRSCSTPPLARRRPRRRDWLGRGPPGLARRHQPDGGRPCRRR